MPSARELPDDLAPLSRRNAFEIHDSSWRDDIQRLVTALDRAIKGDRPATPDEPGAVKPPEPQPRRTQPIRPQSRSLNVGLFLVGALVVCLIVLIYIFFHYLLPAINQGLNALP